MKKLIALFLFFTICGVLPALAGGFRTVLVDAERQPVPGAVVSFYTLPDSALVDAVTSDAEGRVAFANAVPAPMVLRIQALGFLPFVAATGEVGDTLRLDRPTNQLRELVVNAKPVMQRTAGQFTYLPNDLCSMTDNSFELLRLVPLLDVSDRGISIFGKGASRIFINGRDPMIGLDATMEMLRATPPSHIVRIDSRKQIQRRRPPRNSKRGALQPIRRHTGQHYGDSILYGRAYISIIFAVAWSFKRQIQCLCKLHVLRPQYTHGRTWKLLLCESEPICY